jgi:hypothetical protein
MEYPKTENLWVRHPETHLMAPENGYRVEEVGLIISWLVLEKIDGMNMRVIWTPGEPDLSIYGRTDRAVVPGDLMEKMRDYFNPLLLWDIFTIEKGEMVDSTYTESRPDQVVFFGEGYGAGIQQGGHYRPDKDFLLFDVYVRHSFDSPGKWLRWSDVKDVAQKLGVGTVTEIASGCSTEDVEFIVSKMTPENMELVAQRRKDFSDMGIVMPDWTATEQPEGVIARTDPYLFDSRGRRVMFKHKVRDVLKYLESDDKLAESA